MNELNKEIIEAERDFDTMEFQLMSETLSSINFEDKLTDSQYEAITYFSLLHSVSPYEVIGPDGEKCLKEYLDIKWAGIMGDFSSRQEVKDNNGDVIGVSLGYEINTDDKTGETILAHNVQAPGQIHSCDIVINFDDKMDSKEPSAKDATEKYMRNKVKKASELLDNSVPVNKAGPVDLD